MTHSKKSKKTRKETPATGPATIRSVVMSGATPQEVKRTKDAREGTVGGGEAHRPAVDHNQGQALQWREKTTMNWLFAGATRKCYET